MKLVALKGIYQSGVNIFPFFLFFLRWEGKREGGRRGWGRGSEVEYGLFPDSPCFQKKVNDTLWEFRPHLLAF